MPPRAPRGRSALLRRIEAMNLRGARQRWSRMPPPLARRLGARIVRVGDGLMTALEADDALRNNRVIGLGHRGRARERMIDEIIAFYRAAGRRRFSLELGPGPQSGAISRWLLDRGFSPQGGNALLIRDCRRPPPPIPGSVRVVRAGVRRREQVLSIIARSFGLPTGLRPWARASMASPGYRHLLARVGRSVVGAATMRVEGDLAWLGAGATLPRWRRRGVHAALIVARLRRAARRGVRWAWVETAAPGRGQPGGSRRNMLRHGFELACVKPVFVWRERARRPSGR